MTLSKGDEADAHEQWASGLESQKIPPVLERGLRLA
jgi:hypothetical protein